MFWKIVSHQCHYYQPTLTHTTTQYNAILVSSPLFHFKSSYHIEILTVFFFTKLCCVYISVCVLFFCDVYVVRKVNIAVKNDFNSLNEEWHTKKEEKKTHCRYYAKRKHIFFMLFVATTTTTNSQMKKNKKTA